MAEEEARKPPFSLSLHSAFTLSYRPETFLAVSRPLLSASAVPSAVAGTGGVGRVKPGGAHSAEGAERSSRRAAWRKWHLSRVSGYSVGDSGTKSSSSQGESLRKVRWAGVLELSGVEISGAFWWQEMWTDWEGPFLAAGLG